LNYIISVKDIVNVIKYTNYIQGNKLDSILSKVYLKIIT